MRARLVAEMNTPDTSTSAAATAVPLDIKSAPMLDLESQLKANKIEITNRQAEINDLQLKIGQYQSRLNQAPVMEQQFADITRDYDQSKANYDSLLAKKNQSEMATDLEKTQQGEHFTMLDPPDLPAKPYKPNRLKLCLLGLVVGFALGGLTAAGAELLAGKVYTENEIKKLLPFEVIAEIPPLDTPSEIASRKRSTLLAGIATAMIFLCILAGSAITYLRG
jgi:succinoglycan biosynthesis transport protein ExoP